MRQLTCSVCFILKCLLLFASFAFAAEKLPGLQIDIGQSSVSGLSSGAFMTSQFYMVNSDIMVGAGIVAGGPYLCAQSWSFQDYITNATGACMNPLTKKSGPNTPHLVELTKRLAKEGKIADLKNLKNDKIYIFSGKADKTVTTLVVDQTYQYFRDLGFPEKSIEYVKNVDAGHAIITDNNQDTACPLTKSPYINDCDFEQSKEILEEIYGKLNPASTKAEGSLIEFDQKEFIPSPYTSMSDNAYVYVPTSCQKGGCRLHVVFHGCEQGAKVIGNEYYSTTGYNELADTNHFVVLYPQAEPSDTLPYNPKGCWDFWGYSSPNTANPDYYSKDAPQLKAVRAMVDRLSQPVPTPVVAQLKN